MDVNRTEQAVAAVAEAVGAVLADWLGGDETARRHFAAAVYRRTGERACAHAATHARAPSALAIADEAAVVAVCTAAACKRGACGPASAAELVRVTRAAAVAAWRRALDGRRRGEPGVRARAATTTSAPRE